MKLQTWSRLVAKSDRADKSGEQLTHRRLVHGKPVPTPWIVHWPHRGDRQHIYMDNLNRLAITAAPAML